MALLVTMAAALMWSGWVAVMRDFSATARIRTKMMTDRGQTTTEAMSGAVINRSHSATSGKLLLDGHGAPRMTAVALKAVALKVVALKVVAPLTVVEEKAVARPEASPLAAKKTPAHKNQLPAVEQPEGNPYGSVTRYSRDSRLSQKPLSDDRLYLSRFQCRGADFYWPSGCGSRWIQHRPHAELQSLTAASLKGIRLATRRHNRVLVLQPLADIRLRQPIESHLTVGELRQVVG